MIPSILSITLISHPHLSLINEILTLPTLHMKNMFLKHILSNTFIFSSPVHFNDHVSEPYTAVDVTTLSHNYHFTSLENMFSFHNFAIVSYAFLSSSVL